MGNYSTAKVKRLTVGTLDGQFGPDRGKRLVVTFIPGDGHGIPDVLEVKPMRARAGRIERIAVMDVYRIAMRYRVNTEILAKARERKARKAERLARQRQTRAERRLFQHN